MTSIPGAPNVEPERAIVLVRMSMPVNFSRRALENFVACYEREQPGELHWSTLLYREVERFLRGQQFGDSNLTSTAIAQFREGFEIFDNPITHWAHPMLMALERALRPYS